MLINMSVCSTILFYSADCIVLVDVDHREMDKILCQVVEMVRPSEEFTTINEDDVLVYVVDPRTEPPSLKDLQLLYKDQVRLSNNKSNSMR